MKRSRLLIGIAIVCIAGIAVFQFVRHFEDERSADDAPSHESKTDRQHRIVQPTESPQPQPAGLHGTVIDAEGNPMSDVLVEAGVFEGNAPSHVIRKVCVQRTATDSRGEFRFPEKAVFSLSEELQAWVKPSDKRRPTSLHSLLIASKVGYVAERCAIDFDSVTGRQKIVLRKSPEVSGLVVWEEIQQPIPEAEIILESRSMLRNDELYQPRYVLGRTDEEGYFGLSIPAEGEAEISAWVRLAGSRSPFSRITLVPGERITDIILEVKLGSVTLIEGKVLDPEGGPVSGAEVRLSTDKRVGKPVKSRKDGTYQLVVPKYWPYESYFLEDWMDKPNLSTVYIGSDLHVEPQGESRINLRYGRWDWVIWTPPAHAPPERLVAVHPDFEIGVLEVPFLGVGQVRQSVDIVLYKGTEVSGRVLDDSSEPVQEAQIEIQLDPEGSPVLIKNDNKFIRWRNRITPAEDGSFEIRFLREGSYRFTASHEDCDPQTKRLELGPHQVVEGFDFVLVRRTGFIRGRVLDQSGNPWPQGKIKADTLDYFSGLYPHRKATYYTAEVKEDGRYELSRMKWGKYNVWLEVSEGDPEPEGIVQATSLRQVPTGTEGADIIVTEFPAGALRVRVVDDTHHPITKFHIQCSPLRLTYGRSGVLPEPAGDKGVTRNPEGSSIGGAGRSYRRDAKFSGVLLCSRDVESEGGEFVAERVAPGTYFVAVTAEKQSEKFQEVAIEAGRETDVTFELAGLGVLEGIVVDGKGQPLDDIFVTAMKMEDVLNRTEWVRIVTDVPTWEDLYCRFGENKAVTGPNGTFVFEKLEKTEYRVTAYVDTSGRYRRWELAGQGVFTDVSIGKEGKGFVRLVFTPGTGAIEGYVYGANGAVCSNSEVLLQGSGYRSSTRTGEEGHYAFPGLSPGTYLVKAQIGGRTSRHYRAREVELAEGEQASLDIIVRGEGEIEGSVSLSGDAARAAAWFQAAFYPGADRHFLDCDKRLVLNEITDSGWAGGRELRLPVDEAFEIRNVPAATYEARAHYVVRVSPEPLPNWVSNTYFYGKPCYVKFVSPPQIIKVVSGSRATIHLTISDARTPHYPIPDLGTCDKWMVIDQW